VAHHPGFWKAEKWIFLCFPWECPGTSVQIRAGLFFFIISLEFNQKNNQLFK